ncbi:NAD(P)/FAD-dependent oxidoreductase [Limoniibacter endophyticus]|uniref:Oxidoreductase n=1 Tax=Limoniibacter endophyticus TaxID=1565040 RepID=A0A8J3GG23_9HYPH|nr:FAD-binding oxidoreductase [Limoniibacter endophyticus]GHC62488.1 oxidoreductase [Limoniibacter endophyticus]
MQSNSQHDHKTTPFWWEAAPVKPLPPKSLPTKIDVAIVGAGYAGLSAALQLVRAGRSVICLDKMNPGEGASSRNGGITSGNIRLDHATLVRRFGENRALAIEAEGKKAREFLYSFIESEGLACDFKRVGRFSGAVGKQDYEGLARTAEKLEKKLGIEAFAVPQAEQRNYLGTDFYRGGSVRMDIGGLHPAKFHAEILRVALEAGVQVHSGAAVRKVDRLNDGFNVLTDAGQVLARQVLVCTNGYTDASDPWLRRRMVPVRSRIIATEELSPNLMATLMPRLMMCSETRNLGFYYRPSPDGKRILLGGRDGSTSGDPIEPTLHLKRNLDELFPELQNVSVTHSWFGHVAMHRDMIPRIFERDGIVYATGFCGSGVVWAPWIGAQAAKKLLDAQMQARSAFDFRPPAAVPFYSGKPWFMPGVMAWYRHLDRKLMRRAGR